MSMQCLYRAIETLSKADATSTCIPLCVINPQQLSRLRCWPATTRPISYFASKARIARNTVYKLTFEKSQV